MTCRMAAGAQCTKGECCTSTCQFKSSNTVCRGSTGQCDIAEKCTGQSADCPADVFLQDGSTCNNGQAYCYSGQCKTYNAQCQRHFRTSKFPIHNYSLVSSIAPLLDIERIMYGTLSWISVLFLNRQGSRWVLYELQHWGKLLWKLWVWRIKLSSLCFKVTFYHFRPAYTNTIQLILKWPVIRYSLLSLYLFTVTRCVGSCFARKETSKTQSTLFTFCKLVSMFQALAVCSSACK